MKRITAFILISILLLFALCSCGKSQSVVKSYVNDELRLIVEYSDGSTEDLGYVGTADESKNITVTKSYVNDELHAIVAYSDGTSKDLGYVGTIDESKNVTVTKTYVNNELHAIVEYSDGTTKDLGYVGVKVEVEPPLYTVKFFDANGGLLDTQEIYKGKAAKAPTAPEIADMVFMGWDKDFSNVQSNLEVKAVYAGAAEYTVTFKDELGNVLKTETVITGHSATAPTPPIRTDKIFTGWDKSFNSVTGDITVNAQYRAKNTYTVTFKDYSGRVIDTKSVKEGDNAVAPTPPVREGYTFTGWSSSINNVTSSKTVTAQYRLNGGNNIIDISYTLGSNNTLTVTYAVKGTVKFCGVEGYITVPNGLTYKSHTESNGTLANLVSSEGRIYFTMTSNNGQNLTSATTLLTITFGYSQGITEAILDTIVTDIFDQNSDAVSYTVIGETIKVG